MRLQNPILNNPGVVRHQHHHLFACFTTAYKIHAMSRGRLGRRADGRPVGPASRWAATSNVEVDQTTYPVNIGRVVRRGEKGGKDSHKEEEREGWS